MPRRARRRARRPTVVRASGTGSTSPAMLRVEDGGEQVPLRAEDVVHGLHGDAAPRRRRPRWWSPRSRARRTTAPRRRRCVHASARDRRSATVGLVWCRDGGLLLDVGDDCCNGGDHLTSFDYQKVSSLWRPPFARSTPTITPAHRRVAGTRPRRATVPTVTMTFLFTDIEGSTRQWEESPEMYERVERHFVVLRAAVGRGGGEVFATMGDGIAAAFPSVDGRGAGGGRGAATDAVDRSRRADGHPHRRGRARRRRLPRPLRSTGRPGSWPSGTAARSCCRTSRRRSCDRARRRPTLGRPRHAPTPRPHRARAPVAGRAPRPASRSSRPCAASTRTRTTCRPSARRSSAASATSQRVVALTRRHRIVTLTGVGGVGKTRLAVHAAAEMLGDFATVWFVELASVADPDDVADAIARAVGGVAAVDPLAAAVASLAGARRAARGRQLRARGRRRGCGDRRAHGRCPELVGHRDQSRDAGCRRRARRRRALAGSGDDRRRAVPAAGGGRRESTWRRWTGRRSSTLCRRLDGIPLAIELAAARTATLGMAAIAGALDDRLGPVACAAAAVPTTDTARCGPRSSGRTACSMADEQRLFRWLAVFPGGVELDAVAPRRRHRSGIAAAAATEHIESLVHKSMLAPDTDVDGVRYRMLETMRAYRPRAARRVRRTCSRRSPRSPTWMTHDHRPAVRRPMQRRRRTQLRSGSSGRPTTGGRRSSWRRDCARASWPPRCADRRWRSSSSAATTSPTSSGRCSSCAPTPTPAAGGADCADRVGVRRHRPGPAAEVGRGGATDRRRRAHRSRRADAVAGAGVAGRLRRRRSRCASRRRSTRGSGRAPATCSSGSPCSTTSASPTRRATRMVSSRVRSRWRIAPTSPSTGRRACSARHGGLPALSPIGRCNWCAGRSTTSPTCRR